MRPEHGFGRSGIPVQFSVRSCECAMDRHTARCERRSWLLSRLKGGRSDNGVGGARSGYGDMQI